MKKKGQRCRIKGTSPYFKRRYGTSNPVIVIEGTDHEVFGEGWLRVDGNPLTFLFGLRTGEERKGLPTCNVYYGHIEKEGSLVPQAELVWADELEDLEET